ncbi:alpha/beta fold hydrolase [Runella sp. CRIBMP]|uniref:serine aminopeptidase domain-containing protein n=1 Tax=Runella sp. CRIBMP TaxID=2683261 RepID=UPI001411C718|nr:alpha/beta hydrolase [Runella sp. CRIBMP]NBB19340.1 alpha/beta fold hydrolase [Runella sp. CRIBMP]
MRFSVAFAFFILLFSSFVTSAQHLRHKGSLGISYAAASDSLMSTQHLPDSHGILVKSVMPDFTAARLGIQAGDILVSINETDSLYLFDFRKLEQELYEQEPISITYIRNRKKARAVGNVVAAPKEFSKGEVIYGEVPYQRGYLRSIVHKPLGSSRLPAIFYIQGHGCGSVHFADDSLAPVKQLVDGWVSAGYVVFRIEKPGVGESAGTKECVRLSYEEEKAAFQNAFAAFKKLSFVDSTRYFLFGHSLGGALAPLLVAQSGSKPRGIITYGTVVKPWFEHMIDVYRQKPLLYQESYQSIEANTRMMIPLLYEWLVQAKTPTELLQEPDFEAILTSKENPLAYHRGTFFGRSSGYFTELQQQNLTQAWAQAAVPTLALYGEFDSEAISPESAQSIARIVNEVRPELGTYKQLKGTDQHFIKVTSFVEAAQLQKSGQYIQYARRHFNPEILTETVEWMKKFNRK